MTRKFNPPLPVRLVYRQLSKVMWKVLPAQVQYYYWYVRAVRAHGQSDSVVRPKFAAMVGRSKGKDALQIGARHQKHGPHWIAVDLYDKGPLIDFNYDLHNLPFPDASFDFVVAEAILEHVEDPLKAISELHRVLRPGGEIWVDLPMSQQYHPTPNDYWRVTHKGILIWMKNFKEIASGLVPIDGCPFYDYVYFHGSKP